MKKSLWMILLSATMLVACTQKTTTQTTPAQETQTTTQVPSQVDDQDADDQMVTASPTAATGSSAPTESKMVAPKGTVKEFTVTGSNVKFDVKEMKVKKGDTVRVTFKNAEGFHDWVLDEFNVRTKQIAAGKEETVEFVADQAGTFEYYCSVGSHRAMGMKGNLIVQ